MDLINDRNLPIEALQFILNTAQDIAHENDIEGLCNVILNAAMKHTNADGATLYLLNDTGDNPSLRHTLVFNTSLKMNRNLFASEDSLPEVSLYNKDKTKQMDRAASYAYHHNQIVNVADVYNNDLFSCTGSKNFDHSNNYQTKSTLTLPICDSRTSKMMGVFQLINAIDTDGNACTFKKEHEGALAIFADLTASALERQISIDNQRNLLVELSGEPTTQSLIERILREAKHFANADAGTLYLTKESDDTKQLTFELLINDTLKLDSSRNPEILPSQCVPLHLDSGENNLANVASACVHQKQVIVINDAYDTNDYDFSGTKLFDKKFHYRSTSFLVAPLLNHDGKVIGVLQLINALDTTTGQPVPFANRTIQLVKALSNYAAIALNNQLLVQDLKQLLDAFIQCIAQAIDAKSPHTSAHCQRIPLLTEMIAEAACDDQGLFKDFSLNSDEWYELSVASWMHDCGKLATPDSILNKSTKLHLTGDRIEIIEARIASLKHAAHSDFYEKIIDQPIQKTQLKLSLDLRLKELEDDLSFIQRCNKGGEFMAEEDKQKIISLAEKQWIDSQGQSQPLLNEVEVYNLCIERGTLTSEERQIINNHMVVTLDMLESLPFPDKLKNVPEIAGGHHERMDGTGFPRGLTREQLSLPTRMMAIADVFEALTASDRPYKAPMKISVALKIMNDMVKNQHLDPDLFRLFVNAKVWERYAKDQLSENQLDLTEAPRF